MRKGMLFTMVVAALLGQTAVNEKDGQNLTQLSEKLLSITGKVCGTYFARTFFEDSRGNSMVLYQKSDGNRTVIPKSSIKTVIDDSKKVPFVQEYTIHKNARSTVTLSQTDYEACKICLPKP